MSVVATEFFFFQLLGQSCLIKMCCLVRFQYDPGKMLPCMLLLLLLGVKTRIQCIYVHPGHATLILAIQIQQQQHSLFSQPSWSILAIQITETK